jgi:uncharacterized membrane protein (DUF485 family)
MQKVQSYLYPNRVILIADLAGFTVENTIVYAKTVKIYKGVDNVIQFDIQNPDQKRLNLVTTPSISNIKLNVMDASGKALPNSPYSVTPSATVTGIAIVTIPSVDLTSFNSQFLKYSVTATNSTSNSIPLYTDSRFSAVGTMEIVETAVPITRSNVVYDRFSGEINYMGNVTNHTSAIPCKFYESTPTTHLNFSITTHNFIGTIYVEGTEDSTISVESFRNAVKLQTFDTSVATSSTVTFNNVPVGKYNYLRISWTYPNIWQSGQQDPTSVYGMVNTVTVSY